MIRFNCDYAEGAHERILQKLLDTNLEQTPGYGEDIYCEQARELIRRECESPEAYVQFLVGGTQTNLTVIAAALRPHQGVIAAETGHINIHETGAIEASGHKVLAVPSKDGKVGADQVRRLCRDHYADESFEHMVQPGMVYISNPTEIGTIYDRKELEELKQACEEYGLYLFLDGARLGYGLTSRENDLDLPLLARCCDVFYIGGTKVGALFGEAVVISNPALKKDFRYMIKQRGGMLAKGRLLGIQFLELFTDGLYFEISASANRLAEKLKAAFLEHGCSFLIDSSTNQQFPVFKNTELEQLKRQFSFSFWEKVDEESSAVRFCTSWATREEDVEFLIQTLRKL